jgi:hypothetical protein
LKRCYCRGTSESCHYCAGTGYIAEAEDSLPDLRDPRPLTGGRSKRSKNRNHCSIPSTPETHSRTPLHVAPPQRCLVEQPQSSITLKGHKTSKKVRRIFLVDTSAHIINKTLNTPLLVIYSGTIDKNSHYRLSELLKAKTYTIIYYFGNQNLGESLCKISPMSQILSIPSCEELNELTTHHILHRITL